VKRLLIAAALVAAPTPALADTKSAADQWETAFVALNVVDLVQTMDCIHRNMCDEGNPLLGKHPSDAKLIIGKVLLVGLQFAIFEHAEARNPKGALRVAQIGVGMTGATVALNARFSF
jgi:hypothetical protein